MGLDNTQDHGALALWAADCAEHVLPHFEDTHPDAVVGRIEPLFKGFRYHRNRFVR